MAAEGIIFKTNCEVGKNISADQVVQEYDAILLAVGSICPRDIRLPGNSTTYLLHSHFLIPLFVCTCCIDLYSVCYYLYLL